MVVNVSLQTSASVDLDGTDQRAVQVTGTPTVLLHSWEASHNLKFVTMLLRQQHWVAA